MSAPIVKPKRQFPIGIPSLPVAKVEAPVVAPPMVAKAKRTFPVMAEGGGGSRPVKEEDKTASIKETVEYLNVFMKDYIDRYGRSAHKATDYEMVQSGYEFKIKNLKDDPFRGSDIPHSLWHYLTPLINKNLIVKYQDIHPGTTFGKYHKVVYSIKDEDNGVIIITAPFRTIDDATSYSKYDGLTPKDKAVATAVKYIEEFVYLINDPSKLTVEAEESSSPVKTGGKAVSTAWDNISDSEILAETIRGDGWARNADYGVLKPVIIDDTLYYFNRAGQAWRVLRYRQGWGPYVYAGIYNPVNNEIIPTTLEYIKAHRELQSNDEEEILKYMKDGLSFKNASKEQFERHSRRDKVYFTYRGIDFFTGKEYKHGRNADDD